MKKMILAGFSLALGMAFLACKNEVPKTAQPATETAQGLDYAADGGHEHGHAHYKMQFSAPAVQAGEATTLAFTPKMEGNDAALVALDLHHEKKIHLIAVSDDLAFFDHLHPEYQADGSYSVKTTFPTGGKHVLFADYKPTGADGQLEKIALEVGGKTAAAKTWSAPKLAATTADGYAVTLESEIGKFVDKGETHVIVKITKGGKAIKAAELENYLGEKGHAVILSADAEKRYLHVHPGVEADRLHVAASFEKVGTYRAWLQFKHAGKLQTADFVIQVVEGTGETPSHDHDHGHSHGGEKGHSH